MRVQVDMSTCQAYGLCAEEAPEVFELDEWGYPMVAGQGDVPADQEASVRRAVEECPARAIRVADQRAEEEEKTRR